MSKYTVTMTPLEPYTFGTDRGFAFEGEEETAKVSYFAETNIIPEQTSVLGMLRYLVLEKKNLLRAKNDDAETAKQKSKKYPTLIGEKSFSFGEGTQSFGVIKSVSPLFIKNKEGHSLITVPFNVKYGSEEYNPIKIGEEITTSYGELHLPKDGEYDAKKGRISGYLDVDTGKIIDDGEIFTFITLTGNSKQNKEKAFFRRKAVKMADGYSFAVNVEIDDDCLQTETVAFMGKKKAAFKVKVVKTDKTISEKVSEYFASKEGETWYFALSDLFIKENADIKLTDFAIMERRYCRNLTTDTRGAVRKADDRVLLIKKGSVFFGCNPFVDALDENAKNIGYNSIIKIGGGLL